MRTIARLEGGNKFVIFCDFCAKEEFEVTVLIASPNGTHICDECAQTCVEAAIPHVNKNAASPTSEGDE